MKMPSLLTLSNSQIPNLLSEFSQRHLNDSYSDLSFICHGGQIVKSTKILFSMNSEMLRDAFRQHPQYYLNMDVLVKDVSKSALETVIELLTFGVCRLSSTDEESEFVKATQILGISGIDLTVETVQAEITDLTNDDEASSSKAKTVNQVIDEIDESKSVPSEEVIDLTEAGVKKDKFGAFSISKVISTKHQSASQETSSSGNKITKKPTNEEKMKVQKDGITIKCPYCLDLSTTPIQFRAHLSKIHFKKELTQKYGNDTKCGICLNTPKDSEQIVMHMGVYHEKVYDYASKGVQNALLEYKRCKDAKGVNCFQCKLCPCSFFQSQVALNRHRAYIHARVKLHMSFKYNKGGCLYCDNKRFDSFSKFINHLVFFHEDKMDKLVSKEKSGKLEPKDPLGGVKPGELLEQNGVTHKPQRGLNNNAHKKSSNGIASKKIGNNVDIFKVIDLTDEENANQTDTDKDSFTLGLDPYSSNDDSQEDKEIDKKLSKALDKIPLEQNATSQEAELIAMEKEVERIRNQRKLLEEETEIIRKQQRLLNEKVGTLNGNTIEEEEMLNESQLGLLESAEMVMHMEENELTILVCTYECGRVFQAKMHLKDHIASCHFKDQLMEKYGTELKWCSDCKKTYRYNAEFLRHRGTIHDFLELANEETRNLFSEGNDIQSIVQSIKNVTQNATSNHSPLIRLPPLEQILENNIGNDTNMQDVRISFENNTGPCDSNKVQVNTVPPLNTNLCPYNCSKSIPNGRLKEHIVNSHIYKDIVKKYGSCIESCPKCDLKAKNHRNMVRHIGLKHDFLDLVNEDTRKIFSEKSKKLISPNKRSAQNQDSHFVHTNNGTSKNVIIKVAKRPIGPNNGYAQMKDSDIGHPMDVREEETSDYLVYDPNSKDLNLSCEKYIGNYINDDGETNPGPSANTVPCPYGCTKSYNFTRLKEHIVVAHVMKDLVKKYGSDIKNCPKCTYQSKKWRDVIRHIGQIHDFLDIVNEATKTLWHTKKANKQGSKSNGVKRKLDDSENTKAKSNWKQFKGLTIDEDSSSFASTEATGGGASKTRRCVVVLDKLDVSNL